MLGIAVPIRIDRVLLLNLRAVSKDNLCKAGGALGAEHRPAEARADEPREESDVIHVRVREKHIRNRRGVKREAFPVSLAKPLWALKHPEVDEDSSLTNVQQILRAGDGFGGSEELQGRTGR